MHSMRCINGVIFWILFGAVGARFLWQKRGIWRKLVLVVMCAATVEMPLYLLNYFGRSYQSYCRPFFCADLTEALKYSFHHLGHDEVLYISNSTLSPYGFIIDSKLKPFLYAHVLFYEQN